jgi:hypothetical protein
LSVKRRSVGSALSPAPRASLARARAGRTSAGVSPSSSDRRKPEMPRYIVERTFPDGLPIPAETKKDSGYAVELDTLSEVTEAL